MTTRKLTRLILIALLTGGVAGAGHAAKGGEKGKPGGGGGGDDSDSQSKTAVIIEFRDNLETAPIDRVGSDGAVYANDYDEASGMGVEAFIGSQANYGNVMLFLAKAPTRALWLDFGDCLAFCNPLFDADFNYHSSIKVEVDKVVRDGVWGLAVGQSVEAPMRIAYEDPTNPDAGPGFVHFEGVTGGNPCKWEAGEDDHVTVQRTSDTSWTVSASEFLAVCATLPGRKEMAGVFSMPFSFTVTVQ